MFATHLPKVDGICTKTVPSEVVDGSTIYHSEMNSLICTYIAELNNHGARLFAGLDPNIAIGTGTLRHLCAAWNENGTAESFSFHAGSLRRYELPCLVLPIPLQ